MKPHTTDYFAGLGRGAQGGPLQTMEGLAAELLARPFPLALLPPSPIHNEMIRQRAVADLSNVFLIAMTAILIVAIVFNWHA